MTKFNQVVTPGSRKLYSMQALADFLGCSTVTAQKVKNSGKIPFIQVGRKCIFDIDKITAALEHPTTN